ncbi:MAG: LamG domain-containing protein [Magnetococcus sp. YQC-5]
MKMRYLLALAACFVVVDTLQAAPPATLSYQGRVLNAQGARVNGTVNITIRIYDALTGGTKLWEEALTGVTVTDGIFSVILGKTTSLANLAFDKTYYTSMEVNGDGEMSPRTEMASAPYAMNIFKQSEIETLKNEVSVLKAVNTLSRGLVAYYPFNGNILDESGNGNHGIHHGAIIDNGVSLTSDRHGKPNSAYRLNGVDNYIDIGSNSIIKLLGKFTLSAWLKTEDKTTNQQMILSWHKGGIMSGWFIDKRNEFVSFYSAGPYSENNISISNNNWTNITVSFDSGAQQNTTFYINGVVVKSNNLPVSTNAEANVIIGAITTATDNNVPRHFFKGDVDDIRIYNRVLSSYEVQALCSF